MKKNLLFLALVLSFLGMSAQSMELVNPVVQVNATASTLTGAGEMVAEWPVKKCQAFGVQLL